MSVGDLLTTGLGLVCVTALFGTFGTRSRSKFGFIKFLKLKLGIISETNNIIKNAFKLSLGRATKSIENFMIDSIEKIVNTSEGAGVVNFTVTIFILGGKLEKVF